MYNQNDLQSNEPAQNSKNIWTIIISAIITALVVGGGIYVWQQTSIKYTKQDLQQQIEDLQNQVNQFQQVQVNSGQQTGQPVIDLAASWKIYQNNGFEFKYNPSWSISPVNTGSGYDASKPFVLIWAGSVSDVPCQDLGCSPKSGDRDELTKGETFEGAPPLNPWFKILRVRGDRWISVQVTDVNKDCSSLADCQQYLSLAPLTQKLKVNNVDYQIYNDFIKLISTFEYTGQSAIDLTADWELYSNLGVKIKYPNDGTYSVETPENNGFIITQKNVTGNRVHITVEDSEDVGYCNFGGDKTIGDKIFREFHCEGEGSGYGYTIKQNGKNYKFQSVWGPTNDVFELIMTSVQFN